VLLACFCVACRRTDFGDLSPMIEPPFVFRMLTRALHAAPSIPLPTLGFSAIQDQLGTAIDTEDGTVPSRRGVPRLAALLSGNVLVHDAATRRAVADGRGRPSMIQVLARIGSPQLLHHFVCLILGIRAITDPVSNSPRLHAAPRVPRPRSGRVPPLGGPPRLAPHSGLRDRVVLSPRPIVATTRRNDVRPPKIDVSTFLFTQATSRGQPATSCPATRRAARLPSIAEPGSVAPVRFLLSESAPSTRGSG
jgi:hypothetical protein